MPDPTIADLIARIIRPESEGRSYVSADRSQLADLARIVAAQAERVAVLEAVVADRAATTAHDPPCHLDLIRGESYCTTHSLSTIDSGGRPICPTRAKRAPDHATAALREVMAIADEVRAGRMGDGLAVFAMDAAARKAVGQ